MTIPWIQATEPVVGENHPDGLTDVANRAPRFIVSTSGLGDDGSWDGGSFPGFIPNFVGAGSPEGVITATVGKFYHDSTNNKLYYKLTGSGNTGWIELPTTVFTPATESVVYVGKHGNDSNGGRNISDAFLTFGAAAAVATSFSGLTIVCLDRGTYIEDVLIQVNLYAPNARIQGTGASGTTALNLVPGVNDTWFVIGGVTQVGNQASRNYGVRIAAGRPVLYIKNLRTSGSSITGLEISATGHIKVDFAYIESATGAIGIGYKPGVDFIRSTVDIGNIETPAAGSDGVVQFSVERAIVSGTIGDIECRTTGGNGILSSDASGDCNLLINRLEGSSSTSYDAIRVSAGLVNVRVGHLSSAGNAYHISGGTLRLFTMSISGSITNNGGTLVAKDITDIP